MGQTSEIDYVQFTPEMVQALRELALALKEELGEILPASAAKGQGEQEVRQS